MVEINNLSRRLPAAALLTLALLAVLALGGAPIAFAAGPAASCMGHEASSLSPPGSSDELPGGMRDFAAFFRATFPDAPPGAFISFIASLHPGSHEACDEALEG